MAIDTISCPALGNEALPRAENLHPGKTFAEGAAAETFYVLGWTVDLRRLLVILPQDKFRAWTADIDDILKIGKLNKSRLETLVGRLSHTASGIPMSRYFIDHFYRRIQQYKNDFILHFIDAEDRRKLKLWKKFLAQSSRRGVSMNILTFRRPTNLVISDACPSGMGGFSMASGKAWRLQFKTPLDNKNNIGEFLASVVTILLAQIWGDIDELGVVLALTDNSGCVAWLHTCNTDPKTKPMLHEISRTLATTCMKHQFIIHPQHIPGKSNGAADALSRRFDLNTRRLTKFIKTNFHLQVPRRTSKSVSFRTSFPHGSRRL